MADLAEKLLKWKDVQFTIDHMAGVVPEKSLPPRPKQKEIVKYYDHTKTTLDREWSIIAKTADLENASLLNETINRNLTKMTITFPTPDYESKYVESVKEMVTYTTRRVMEDYGEITQYNRMNFVFTFPTYYKYLLEAQAAMPCQENRDMMNGFIRLVEWFAGITTGTLKDVPADAKVQYGLTLLAVQAELGNKEAKKKVERDGAVPRFEPAEDAPEHIRFGMEKVNEAWKQFEEDFPAFFKSRQSLIETNDLAATEYKKKNYSSARQYARNATRHEKSLEMRYRHDFAQMFCTLVGISDNFFRVHSNALAQNRPLYPGHLVALDLPFIAENETHLEQILSAADEAASQPQPSPRDGLTQSENPKSPYQPFVTDVKDGDDGEDDDFCHPTQFTPPGSTVGDDDNVTLLDLTLRRQKEMLQASSEEGEEDDDGDDEELARLLERLMKSGSSLTQCLREALADK